MATTGSSGLNNALQSTDVTQTTLPSWYCAAQQNIVNQANTALGQAPQMQNTVAQGAINTLQSPNNPFTQAQNTLGSIASGAANPWITTPAQQPFAMSPMAASASPICAYNATGATMQGGACVANPMTGMGGVASSPYALCGSPVMGSPMYSGANQSANPAQQNLGGNTITPNTNTAMGGLFAAQNQQLNQLLPTTIAPDQANAIGSGNFGSLRGQTAVDTAKTNAFDTLAAQQMQAALQNQQTGVSAATGLGNVANQGITSGLNAGTYQMNAPFQGASNYANIVNSIQAPTTASRQTQNSALQAATQLGGVLSGGLSALAGTAGGKSLLCSLGLSKWLPGSASSTGGGGALPTGVPTGATLDPNGSGNYTLNGQTYSPTGQLICTSGSVSSGGACAVNATIGSCGSVTSAGCANAWGAG